MSMMQVGAAQDALGQQEGVKCRDSRVQLVSFGQKEFTNQGRAQ